jgi:hypothetical protein
MVFKKQRSKYFHKQYSYLEAEAMMKWEGEAVFTQDLRICKTIENQLFNKLSNRIFSAI